MANNHVQKQKGTEQRDELSQLTEYICSKSPRHPPLYRNPSCKLLIKLKTIFSASQFVKHDGILLTDE